MEIVRHLKFVIVKVDGMVLIVNTINVLEKVKLIPLFVVEMDNV